jgi:hypothetical protein
MNNNSSQKILRDTLLKSQGQKPKGRHHYRCWGLGFVLCPISGNPMGRVQGFFDDRKKTEDINGMNQRDKTILGTISDLCGYLEHHDVDYVYIALPMRAEKKIHEILNSC